MTKGENSWYFYFITKTILFITKWLPRIACERNGHLWFHAFLDAHGRNNVVELNLMPFLLCFQTFEEIFVTFLF